LLGFDAAESSGETVGTGRSSAVTTGWRRPPRSAFAQVSGSFAQWAHQAIDAKPKWLGRRFDSDRRLRRTAPDLRKRSAGAVRFWWSRDALASRLCPTPTSLSSATDPSPA